ncbi:MAG: outer membrane beta-barrel protein [Acidobacteriota bacterium]|nr:outer membrane beta-barrel protein [Acidobacteriota bacterium]
MKTKIISKRMLIVICLLLAIAFMANFSQAAGFRPRIEAGCSVGLRALNNSQLRDVYGSGINVFPNVTLIWKGVMFGLGYEAGFKPDGIIGIYEEPAELSVKGLEVFAGYQMRFQNFAPYVKIGYGFYAYKQIVDSEYVDEFPVDGNKSGLLLAGGVKYYPLRKMFISVEVKYGSLKVKPYDVEIDVGGVRVNGGIGVSF